MDEHIFDKVNDIDLKSTMEDSYIDYAMSVIVSRALPDVRDGLKPVQRRILYSMKELNNGPDRQHRKCARIVGETMGKYHPHGDSSIYEALVKLAQDFSTRYPLVDGHGNFGSIDGDSAAAMRYTEARYSKIAKEMLAEIEKDTVDFIDNFDGTEREPVVLPARVPNLLINGTSGIAVGMATNIPPHNLREVIYGVIKLIDNRVEEDRDTQIEELLDIVKGPDFPTGAMILGKSAIEEAYRTGRAKIRVRAVSDVEPMQNGKSRIVVTEIPYMVNKAKLIEKIADLVKEKKVDGITDLRDESNREGMRIVIELRKDSNPTVVLNQLYKHTQLQDTFGVIMLALVDNEPKVLNLHDMLYYYLKHQEDVVTRRIKYDLDKAEKRAHIIKGLLIALDNIDEVISIIRSSQSVQIAKQRLMERFGLTDVQCQAIVEMQLRALTGLEREKLNAEYDKLMAEITEWKAILADEKKLLGVIKTELLAISEKYGDDRRTSIGYDEYDISMEDLIPDDDTVVAMTKLGYIKRMTADNFKPQNRGGKGIKGMQTIEDDYIEELFMSTNHSVLLFFTNKGRVYKLKTYEIPEASRIARGTAVINLIQLSSGEKVTAVIPVKSGGAESDKYLFMTTKKGIVKKTRSTEFGNIRKNGIQAMNLQEDDELIEVKETDGTKEILIVTKQGMCIRFKENDVRPTGRSAMGVIGMSLSEDDEIIGMQLNTQGESMLIVSENGMGKKTDISEFNVQYRGGKGVKCYKINDKTGYVIGAKIVDETREIMLISNEGTVIRMLVNQISNLGRITSGVKMMDLRNNEKVATVAKVRITPNDEDIPEEMLEAELEGTEANIDDTVNENNEEV